MAEPETRIYRETQAKMKTEEGFFPVGFWNYVPCGTLDAERSAEDWRELGMNLAMSCDYLSPADKDFMLKNLDAAHRNGLKVIVCDCRTTWKNYAQKGEKAFRGEVKEAAEDFASHPAFYAFHVGDEPDKDSWEDMLAAAKIVKEYAPPFVNYFPYFEEDFEKRVGTDHAGYTRKLADAVGQTGLTALSYDCYNQCLFYEREKGIDDYFYNLNSFYKTAKECGLPMWTTLLSVGHWCYRVPTEDDLRWQISTAAAHGAKGLLWFYVYGRFLESSYRQSPFDQYYRRTETFESLARQNKLFRDHFAPRLASAELLAVYHLGRAYGGTAEYKEGCIEGLTLSRKYGNPLIISEFSENAGGRFLVIVDNSQTDIEKATGVYRGKTFECWLAPGQMTIIE